MIVVAETDYQPEICTIMWLSIRPFNKNIRPIGTRAKTMYIGQYNKNDENRNGRKFWLIEAG